MFTKHPTLPAIVHPVDPMEYHKIDADVPRAKAGRTMSQSALKVFGLCPHKWVSGYEEEDTAAKTDGSICDTMILTPELFEKRFVVAPELYPCKPTARDPRAEKPWSMRATFCQEWAEQVREGGKEPITMKQAEMAARAREIFYANDHIQKFHEQSRLQVQVNVQWVDESTGVVVPVKCLIDIVPFKKNGPDKFLADFKRTNDASYKKWVRTIFNFQLHYQAAFYLDAYNAATGEKRNSFEHHIQESEAPFETTHRELSAEFISRGRSRYESDFHHYCRCVQTQKWQGYDQAIAEPELWMLSAD